MTGIEYALVGSVARRRMAKVDFLSDVEVPVTSPEDIVLAKLRWYDLGRRTSERQWSDIPGVMRNWRSW